MSVILLTIFLSLVLVVFFIVLFLHESGRDNSRSSERHALMPLEEEKSVSAQKTEKRS